MILFEEHPDDRVIPKSFNLLGSNVSVGHIQKTILLGLIIPVSDEFVSDQHQLGGSAMSYAHDDRRTQPSGRDTMDLPFTARHPDHKLSYCLISLQHENFS